MITEDALGVQLPNKITVEGHSYGNVFIAAKYCGFRKPLFSINGEWQHGAIIPERNIHPEFVIGSDGKSIIHRNVNTFYVAREDQKKYLESCGFKYVHAIGLPILYLERPKIERVLNSLLIMPIHSLPDTKDDFNSQAYAEYIDRIAPQFGEIALCIHSSCLKKGHWMQPFIDRGITIIEGADEKDINSLNRMAHLFCRFDYVTTNGFGSHLAYAAFFGAKVSISGPQEKFVKNNYKNVLFYSNVPILLDVLETWNNEEFVKRSYPFLYVEPKDAIQLTAWASFQLGSDQKRTPGQLKKIFGWSKREILILKLKGLLTDKTKNRIRYAFTAIKEMIISAKTFLVLTVEVKIFSHLTLEEKLVLYKTSKSLPSSSIVVEIGSYLGSSSSCIAKGLKSDGRIVCIDTWGNQNMKYDDKDSDTDERDTYSEFTANTQKYRTKIIEIRKWSYDAIEDVKKITDKIDFLFIDGDHHYEGVKKDWDLYRQLLKEGSLVGFHDTGWAEGVQKVINEDVILVAEKIKTLPNMEIFRIEK